MEFHTRHINRLQFPSKHIVVCEDDIDNQVKMVQSLRKFFPPQGDVQIDFVCSAMGAAAIVSNMKVNLIILDHDMPYGSGSELIRFLKETGKTIPVITASGIPENNTNMKKLGDDLGYPVHEFHKEDVFNLKIRDVIKSALYG